MPDSASRRQTLVAAGQAIGSLAGIVYVLAIGNAALGGAELVVTRPSAAGMSLVALALAATSLLAPASRTAAGAHELISAGGRACTNCRSHISRHERGS